MEQEGLTEEVVMCGLADRPMLEKLYARAILDILSDDEGYSRVSASARATLYQNWDDVVREVYTDYCSF